MKKKTIEFWVSRDNRDGFVWAHKTKQKPKKQGEYFLVMNHSSWKFPKYMFPEITWENSPVKFKGEI